MSTNEAIKCARAPNHRLPEDRRSNGSLRYQISISKHPFERIDVILLNFKLGTGRPGSALEEANQSTQDFRS